MTSSPGLASASAPACRMPDIGRRVNPDRARDLLRFDGALERGEQRLPPLPMALEEQGVGHAVARDVRGRDAVPAAMLDGDAGLGADGLEPDLDLGALILREAGLAPSEGDQGDGGPRRRRLPLRDA